VIGRDLLQQSNLFGQRTGSDNRTMANFNITVDECICANPDIITQYDPTGFVTLQTDANILVRKDMVACPKDDIGTDDTIIAYMNIPIQISINHNIRIGRYMITNKNAFIAFSCRIYLIMKTNSCVVSR